MTDQQRAPLRRVGSLWKPKPGARSKGSGVVTVGTLRQRFVIFVNDRKQKDSEPDYVLMSSDEPEPDEYVTRRMATAHDGPPSKTAA